MTCGWLNRFQMFKAASNNFQRRRLTARPFSVAALMSPQTSSRSPVRIDSWPLALTGSYLVLSR